MASTSSSAPARSAASAAWSWHNRGRLPHWEAGAVPQHLVWRLHDSLPVGMRRELVRTLHGPSTSSRARLTSKAIEDALDRHEGQCHLRDPRVAQMVEANLLRFAGERYALHAWVVMPNHVHVLATPEPPHRLSSLVHTWKSFTGHEANRILSRTGPFWDGEYFDRAVRDNDHFLAVRGYIEANPVKAGLCAAPAEWPFSSARHEQTPTDAG